GAGRARRRGPAPPSAGRRPRRGRRATPTAVTRTGAETVAPKKTTTQPMADQTGTTVPAARPAGISPEPEALAVRPGEDPWTSEEVAHASAGLLDDAGRLRAEILA